ncbi:MAG: glycosyltransferase family 2 protein [Candidatus Omnitrophica bacterium]|jgi:glycosyltransferase involved in cell wall biosynthesis|nr:glycosyltransferase family 2 protein [Candidatus Omnitrophota bacterium]
MDKQFSISFVLPMYNEKDNIEKAVAMLAALAPRLADDYEIVFVDDASTDGSADIAETVSSRMPEVKVFRLKENSKFGGAFAEGFRRASKDVIIYMDSDIPVRPEDIEASFPLIRENDVVSAYSVVKKGDTLKRKIMSLVYNFMVRALFGLSIRDINSGYKIARRETVKDAVFVSRSPFVDVELFAHAAKKKARIAQFPVTFLGREGGISYMARPSIILATFRDMIKVRAALWTRK